MDEAKAVGWIRIDEDVSFKVSSILQLGTSYSHKHKTGSVPTKDDDNDHTQIQTCQRNLGESTTHSTLLREHLTQQQSNKDIRDLGFASPEWLEVDDEVSLYCKTNAPDFLKPKLVTNENLHETNRVTTQRGAQQLGLPLDQGVEFPASSFSISSHLVDKTAPMSFNLEPEPQNLSRPACGDVRHFTHSVPDVQEAVSCSLDSSLGFEREYTNVPLTERTNTSAFGKSSEKSDIGTPHFVGLSVDGVTASYMENESSFSNDGIYNYQNISCDVPLEEQTTFHNGLESINGSNSESDDCMIIENEVPNVIVIDSEDDSFTEDMSALMTKCNTQKKNDNDKCGEFEMNRWRCDFNTKKDQELLERTCSKLMVERSHKDKCENIGIEYNSCIKVEPSDSMPEKLAVALPQIFWKEMEMEMIHASDEPETECPPIVHLPLCIKEESVKDTVTSTGQCVVNDHNKGVELFKLTSLKQEKMDSHKIMNCGKTFLELQHSQNQENNQQVFDLQNSFVRSNNLCSEDKVDGLEVQASIVNLCGQGKSEEHKKNCEEDKASRSQQMLGIVEGVPHTGSTNMSEELANHNKHKILKYWDEDGKNSDLSDFMMNRSPVSFCFEIQDQGHMMSQQLKNKTAGGSRGEGQRRSHGQKQLSSGKKQPQGQKAQIYEPYLSLQEVNDGIKRGHLIVGPIRVNPKNYEDAYVPMPDGRDDIYIQGMAARNRALNTDSVVVLLHDHSKWRVFLEDFESFERSQSFSTLDAPGVNNDEANDNSQPDIIFENDDEEEKKCSTASETANKSNVGGVGATGANTVADDIESSESLASGLKDLSMAGASPDVGKSLGMTKMESSPGKMSAKSGSPSLKKFSCVSDMAKYGSPLAKNLFGSVSSSSMGQGEAGRFLQRTGKVVYIYEKKHSRAASGHVKLMPDRSKNFALFSPTDSRVPRIVIPMAECPKDFMERADDYARTLFIARIQEWTETSKMPKGTLCRSLGEAGQIEPETEAMLIEMDVDDSPFSPEVERCLPQDLPWTIPKEELSSRRDLRKMCIFTIDPATARDLDDAVSIEVMENGLYSVGVHIADVSYFVQENTELDAVASNRATSVYLIQKVIPMLPRLLCEELCSLNPDTDRLTFSVMWTINDQGEIFDEWYGRTVIRSCAKLSYDHAQGFIEQPTKKWTQDELPPISNSFGVEDVMKRVLQLNKLAVALRKQRFDNGALRLDQVKLQYSLNGETGMPNGYYVYQQRDSNRLIEEFMLLANMAVAHKIKISFPTLAILRRHPAPQLKPLEAVEEMCESLGMKINTGTAGSLQESLRKYYKDDEYSAARLQVLIVLLSKPMQNARYFCTGSFPDEALYHHYALNVPLYTHFTSPIRRYPDIMVHRLLAASLGYCEPTKKSTGHLQKQADFCNDKKNNAKMASDRSSDMFFALFVKEAGPLEEMGMVMAVLDKAFDVLILKLGVTKRVYLDKLPLLSSKFRKNHKTPELAIVWAADEACSHRTHHLITLFTKVQCYVYADKEPLRWSCVIKRPTEELKPLSPEESLS